MVFTLHLSKKKLRFYCAFQCMGHLKNFRREILVNKNNMDDIFVNSEEVRVPISDSFILFRKLFKVIFFLKLSPKCLGNTLKLFKTS